LFNSFLPKAEQNAQYLLQCIENIRIRGGSFLPFLHFEQKQDRDLRYFMKSIKNRKNKFLVQLTFTGKVIISWMNHFIKIKKKFQALNTDIKKSKILRMFKGYKFTLVDKMHL
jgi:5,10-methylenetetrahydrofolate reductase